MSVLPQSFFQPVRRPAPARALGVQSPFQHTCRLPAAHRYHFGSRWHPSERCAATSADPQQQDVTEIEDATKRWGKQVREGKVKSVTTKSAADLIKGEWTLLDVRPKEEVEVAPIEGAVTVPLFVVDEDLSAGTFLKKVTAFGMGGWWEGGTHMIPNPKFLTDVQKKIPKDRKVVVACQKGLRSLAATEQLSQAGYPSLAWINGGFETAKPGELPVKGGTDVRLAGIGGLSALLGWTEVQQQTSKGFLGGQSGIVKIAALVLLLDGILFIYEQAQVFLKPAA